MSNRFPAPCPVSKMIKGSKAWCGFPGFNFPGFVGTFDATSGGPGTYPGWGASPPTPVPGDLCVQKVLGLVSANASDGVTFPNIYLVFKCILAGSTASGRSVLPQTDTAYWEYWDFKHGSAIPPGPTYPWPIDDGFSSLREVWSLGMTVPTAYLTLTSTTTLASFPAVPSGTGVAGGDTYSPHYLAAGNGTFEYQWTVNRWTGAVTYTPPGTAPSTDQAVFVFPEIPVNYDFTAGSPPLQVGTATQYLVSWDFTATSLTFVWAAWPQNGQINVGLYSSSATITQVFAVSGEYDLATDASDALALLSGTTFSALQWNQLATCSYNSDGSISTVITTMPSTTTFPTACSGGVPSGSPATVASGYAFSVFTGGVDYGYGKALVDVCGKYCLRTFYCGRTPPVIDCASGTVDGYAPVEIDPPSINPALGDTEVDTYLFPNCVCS